MDGLSMAGRRAWLLVAISVAAFLGITGCAPGATAADPPASSSAPSQNPQTTPETQRSIATAIALRAADGGGGITSNAAQQGPRTVAEIAASAPTSGGLDNRHLAAGKGCDACHGSTPAEGRPSTPTSAQCLSCHGGSNDALAAKTAALGSRNPHKAHTGRQDCVRCHGVHRPFEYSCNSCHTFPIPEKYRGGV